MCFTHTFQGYIHQEKIASASKNRLSNLLMHVWKIQKVWDEYKNNLEQKAEEWEGEEIYISIQLIISLRN